MRWGKHMSRGDSASDAGSRSTGFRRPRASGIRHTGPTVEDSAERTGSSFRLTSPQSSARDLRAPPERTRPPGPSRWLLLLASALLLLTSCRGDPGDADPPTSAGAAASTTTTLSLEQAAVWDGYRAFWQAYRALGAEERAAEPFTRATFDTELGPHVTGSAYGLLLESMSQGRLRGQFFRGPMPDHDPRPEITVQGDTATVRDCMLDPGEIYDGSRQTTVDPPSATRKLQIASMAFVDGSWRLSEPLEGGEPCAP